MDGEAKEKPAVGDILRGQGWVELHGVFSAAQLKSIADTIDKQCKNLERKQEAK